MDEELKNKKINWNTKRVLIAIVFSVSTALSFPLILIVVAWKIAEEDANSLYDYFWKK